MGEWFLLRETLLITEVIGRVTRSTLGWTAEVLANIQVQHDFLPSWGRKVPLAFWCCCYGRGQQAGVTILFFPG